MEIILNKEWMGSPEGSILNIEDKTANRLIQWGTAKEYNQPGRPSKKNKKEKDDERSLS
jgi:hypothetical protein